MHNYISLLAASAIFITTLISGLWFIFKKTQPHTHLIYEALVGGLFIGIGIFHLLPDALHSLQIAQLKFPYLVVLVLFFGSFLALLLAEFKINHPSPTLSESKILSGNLIMGLLSVHSIIGGLAIGLNAQLSDKLLIFIAILAHKMTDSFALVINLKRRGFHHSELSRYIFIFAWMTPLGMGLASYATTHLSSSILAIWIGIFSVLAASSFIYIGSLEGPIRQFIAKKQIDFKTFAIMLVGFAMAGTLALWG